MQESELLRTIRSTWLNHVLHSLARGSGIRENLRCELERFFELLEQVVETGDPTWLDTILSTWAASLTQTDLEENRSNLTLLVKELFQQAYTVSRETLTESESLDLIGALLPCFSYSFEKAAQFESQARVEYVSGQLSQTQQALEKIDRSKSDFIAVAAHELKTPLTLIEGYTAILRENITANGSATEQAAALLNGIDTGSLRLKNIIDDMIDVSLIDNDLLTLTSQPVWLNQFFSILKTELAPVLKERKLELEIKSFPGSAEMNFGDPDRLLQLFRNLLSNALKFTPDGGRITVDGRTLPGFIEITITDTGIGIDTEDQAIIFDKFSRLSSSTLHSSGKTKYKGGGPGLGLHIAKGIIEGHGGAIWVESPGCDETACPGSTFHVMLPMRDQPASDNTARLFAEIIQNSPLNRRKVSEEKK